MYCISHFLLASCALHSCCVQEAGASTQDVLGAIKSNPWILGLDLEAHARPTLELLSLYGFQQAREQGEQEQEVGGWFLAAGRLAA
jgi:hypothetical protein